MVQAKEAPREQLPDVFGRNWLDRFFGGRWVPDWLFGEIEPPTSAIRVEEFLQDATLVVRVELPGIDPDKDVELTVHEGMLDIHAHRRAEAKEKGRSEFRYGSFRRMLTLPTGVAAEDIAATYEDGILEVRVPVGEAKPPAVKVPVNRG